MGNRGLVRTIRRVLAALLVASLLEQVPFLGAAVAADSKSHTIPPITSPRASQAPDAPPGGGGVVLPSQPPTSGSPSVAPRRTLTGFDAEKSTELVDERTAKNRVFANPDGTRTTRAFSAPVHMQDASGRWVDIDTTLRRGDDGRFRPKAAPGNPDFASAATDPVLARVTLDAGHSVGFGLVGAGPPAQAVSTGNKVTYPGALGTASVTLTATPTGVKEELVLIGLGGPTTFDFPLHLTGLTAEVDPATGDVLYRDESGVERVRTPHGWMRDSAVGPQRRHGALSTGVTYNLVPGADGGLVLRMSLDEAWLADPARVWPVTVDPSYWLSTDFEDDTFVTSGVTRDAAWEDYLAVGTENGGVNVSRSYMNFDVSGLDWRRILSATFHVYEFYAPSCSARGLGVYRVTQAWGGHTMTSFEPGAATYGERVAWSSFAKGAPGCDAGWTSWDITGTVHNWTHGTWNDYGLMMRADPGSETDNMAFKAFASWDGCNGVDCVPHIDIVWNGAPSTPSLHSPAPGDTAHNLTPTLSASSSDPNSDTIHYLYEVCGVMSGVYQCPTSGWGASMTSWQVPSGWLTANQSYTWRVLASDEVDESGWSGTRTFTPTNTTPTMPTLRSPVGADAMVGTSTLSFTADSTDGNGDAIKYLFQVATGSDGQTGRIATSTWQSTTTWTPPPGTFADGGTYYWTAKAQDAWGATTGWQTAQQFRIDFRLGKRDTMPYDSLGPATVNLSNGNVLLSVAGPSFPTVGGPVGVSFSYNSQTPVVHGMVGDYHQDVDADGVLDPGEPNLLHRIDPTLDFSFGTGSGPNPGVLRPDRWIGHWSGAIRVPPASAGWGEADYVFVSDRSDDSVTLRTGGPTGPVVLSAPGCCQYVTGQSTVRLSPTSGTNLDLLFTQAAGPAALRLRIRKASAPAGSEIAIPSDWLTTTQPALPGGWSRSADSPVPDAYTAVRPVTGTTTAVVDDAGTDHLFTWTGTSWKPPADSDSVLTQNTDSTWSLAGDDGYLYTFRSDGRLTSIVSAVDDVRPGAPVYQYEPNANGVVRLRTITDAAGRAVTFSYAPSTECPVPPVGFDALAPTDMLCKVSYGGFDGTETRLFYSGGHLARIVNPGGATVDFGYDATGLLRSVRDVLTNDLIAGGVITDGEADTHKTLIEYVSGRVTSVKGPVPDAATTDAQRPRHTYAWTVNATTKLVTRAAVDVAGLSGGAGQPADARVVDLDSGGHATRDVDAAGIAVDTVWDNLNDRPNKVTDGHFLTSPAGGLVTTTKYDAAGRVTDTYGPALASEFAADNTSATAPRTRTNYDEGIPGLAATWYATSELTGAPKGHTTSALNHNWGTGSPASGVPADDFSGRLTGEVTVPGTSAATLTLNADGGRIYVDGALASGDTWGGPYRSAVRADRPVSHWRLGDATGSSTAADTAGFSPGTYTGAVTRGVPGALAADADKAASFDGPGGYVGVSGLDGAFAGHFAVEALVKFDAVNRGTDNAVFGHGVAQPNQGLHLGERAGKPYFGFYGNDLAGTTPLQANAWYHLAFVYDGTQRIFVNGALDSQRTASSYTGPGGTARIGSYNYGGSFDGVVDELAVYRSAPSAARVAAHHQAVAQTTATARATVAPGTPKLRVDYQELIGNAGLTLTSSVAGTTFAPRYNLATSQRDADGRWTRTEYAAPETGLPTATVTDPVIAGVNPNGLDLRSTTAYEPASATTFFRRTSRTLPKGPATTVAYTHYLIDETADDPCPGGQAGVNQAGAVKRETNADPDGTGPQSSIVREYRYDRAGRVAARRVVGDAAWTCTDYDDRGRVTSRTDSSGKTTTYIHAVADRVTEAATGSDGTTRTTVSRLDWLGRTVAYTDELGTVTRRTWDQVGRPTGVYRTFSGQAEATVQTLAYDNVGRLASTTEHLSGGPRTTGYAYNAAGQMVVAGLPNNATTNPVYDPSRGWVSKLRNTASSGAEVSTWTYGHSPSGDVTSEVAETLGRTRTFGYDGAGRLTSVGGTTTRNYAYDADSNRCAEATTCATPTYTYDDADRIVSSPDWSSYTYDGHGNLTSATRSTAPPSESLNRTFTLDAANPLRHDIVAGQAGTVSASLDWTSGGTPWASGTASGSITASGTSTTTIPVDGMSDVRSDLTWAQDAWTKSDALTGSVNAGGTTTRGLSVTDTGTISASVGWAASSSTATSNGTVAPLSQDDRAITVSADGPLTASLTWPPGTPDPNLDLELLDPSGAVVASSTRLTGTSESITYNVAGLGSYPATRTYALRVKAVGLGSPYTLTSTGPVTADVDLELWSPSGSKVAQASGSSTKPETLAYTAGSTGTYTLKVLSKDHAASFDGSVGYPTVGWSDLTLNLKGPSGAVVATKRAASGSASVVHGTASGGQYTLEIVNNSPTATVPSFSMPWSTTMQAADSWSGTDVAPSEWRSHTVAVDGEGHLTADLTWTGPPDQSVTLMLRGPTGNPLGSVRGPGGSLTYETKVTKAGTYTLELYNFSGQSVPSFSVLTRAPRTHVATVLRLRDAAGAVVAENSSADRPKPLTAAVEAGHYRLEVATTGGGGTGTLTASHPGGPSQQTIAYDAEDHAVSVDDGATKVAETLSPSGRVLRRVVTDNATDAVLEDTDFGYDGPGDSPAYSRPHGGGTVTTYLGDVVYTGTTATWQVVNLHGDVVGTTDAAGLFTATPTADEFGAGPAPADRLGWLGGKDRFNVGGRLGLIRMGVRLYDTTTGRFTSVDPVEGGTPNDYVYPTDPVNEFDLDGRQRCWKKKGKWKCGDDPFEAVIKFFSARRTFDVRQAPSTAGSYLTGRGIARAAAPDPRWKRRVGHYRPRATEPDFITAFATVIDFQLDRDLITRPPSYAHKRAWFCAVGTPCPR